MGKDIGPKTTQTVSFPVNGLPASKRIENATKRIADRILKYMVKKLSVVEIITAEENRSYNMSSKGRKRFSSAKEYYNRIACIYERLSELGIGPKVEGVVICDHQMIVVTEYIPMVLSPERPLTEKQYLEIEESIERAISIMHKNGIVHGSIEPHNIAVDLNDQAYILSPINAFYDVDLDILGDILREYKKLGSLSFNNLSGPPALTRKSVSYKDNKEGFFLDMWIKQEGSPSLKQFIEKEKYFHWK